MKRVEKYITIIVYLLSMGGNLEKSGRIRR